METVTKLSSSQSFKKKKEKKEKSCRVEGGGGGDGGVPCTVRGRFSKSVSFLSEGETFIVSFFV